MRFFRLVVTSYSIQSHLLVEEEDNMESLDSNHGFFSDIQQSGVSPFSSHKALYNNEEVSRSSTGQCIACVNSFFLGHPI